MKKHKLLLSVILLISICICFSIVLAEDGSDIIVSLQIDNPVMKVNGVDTEIDVGRGTKPIVINGRTLVPIRAIIESFGGIVGWEESTQSVLLNMGDNAIKLVINSNDAYLNDSLETLDVAPAVINGRTMLPIRFIAEGFNLGVAWDNDTQTVFIIKNSFDDTEYNALIDSIPEYSGEAYTEINNNTPFFKDYEIINASFEYYSELDELGRCGVCLASFTTDLMPIKERESISSILPTGWNNMAYEDIEGGYLYNRCHLIGYQLTGENANEKNLITGTRYLNVEGMLPFENIIADYIKETENQVIYRSTPIFRDNNLVADGVLLEAYSVEDNGEGISFCVYCYNIQPNIKIDYRTGESTNETGTIKTDTDVQTLPEEENDVDISTNIVSVVYRTPSGIKYHFDAECGGKNSFEISLDEAINVGLSPCSKCVE